MDSTESVELVEQEVQHTYELNVDRIKTIDDVKVVLKSLGIKYTEEAINNNTGLKKLVK